MSTSYTYENFSTSCLSDLLLAIDTLIPSASLIQLVNIEGSDIEVQFNRDLTSSEKSELDDLISTWECPIDNTVVVDIEVNNEETPIDSTPVWNGDRVVWIAPTSTNKVSQVPFSANGAVSNKWLSLFSSADSSDNVPFVTPYDGSIKSVTFTNERSNCNCDIEVYINGTNVKTIEVRNQATDVDLLSNVINISANDTISVFIKKQGKGNEKAKDPVITLWLSIEV